MFEISDPLFSAIEEVTRVKVGRPGLEKIRQVALVDEQVKRAKAIVEAEQERIVSAAIRIKYFDDTYDYDWAYMIVSCPAPKRHHHAIKSGTSALGVGVNGAVRDAFLKAEQGFLTSKGRFVDRKEGLSIALAAKQVAAKHGNPFELYSEDLW